MLHVISCHIETCYRQPECIQHMTSDLKHKHLSFTSDFLGEVLLRMASFNDNYNDRSTDASVLILYTFSSYFRSGKSLVTKHKRATEDLFVISPCFVLIVRGFAPTLKGISTSAPSLFFPSKVWDTHHRYGHCFALVCLGCIEIIGRYIWIHTF